ncbi:ABC transporter ATP-binding protein [Paenibacillus mesophilus]|uniref:ABC transporter ATP-binding protein n=1 Tax=Paenibacillus mesophilus TaxID=2582849 RepID=UPI00110D8685|nr:ABC transporter ATP-binding protein [Paenibacillus mesophilus]TMV49108.1 ABC transporter ATP-binding protein [Paenibacillus mesophilus]
MANALLELRDVEVAFTIGKRTYPALQQITFQVGEKETVGIVGESGCGKSLTSLSVMGLLPETAAMTGGGILLNGKPMEPASRDGWSAVRGKQVSMIFQNPMSALNPLMPVGKQIAEMAMAHLSVSKQEAKRLATDMMAKVGLSRVERLYEDYPHLLSGGMMQRIMIAMALICTPKLLIADEPTTALDVTIQAQILDLLREMNRSTGTSILFISHDLGVIREVCDRVIVMYAGYIVEDAPLEELLDHPKHPYTAGLLQSLPSADKRGGPLYTIPGRVPSIADRRSGCPFAGRCPSVSDLCESTTPELRQTAAHHRVRCHLYADGGMAL